MGIHPVVQKAYYEPEKVQSGRAGEPRQAESSCAPGRLMSPIPGAVSAQDSDITDPARQQAFVSYFLCLPEILLLKHFTASTPQVTHV